MSENNTAAPASFIDEEHALIDALKFYLSTDKDPIKERAMMDVARSALSMERRLKRPTDVDISLWHEANEALREAAQHKILTNGNAVVLGFMPVTIGLKSGSIIGYGEHFNAENINDIISKMYPDVAIKVANAWFTEDQVKDAHCNDLHGLLNMIIDGKELSGHWSPGSLTMDDTTHFARMFLALTITVEGPLENGWSYEWPFHAIDVADPSAFLALEDTLWSTVERSRSNKLDIYVQIMEPLLHSDALAESQTQMDLLQIEHSLQFLNSQVDNGHEIQADLKLQVVWPQEPEDNQHPEAQPNLRMRILYKVNDEETSHQAWYPISYDSKNTDMWHDLLVEVMQMVYSLGHGSLHVEQISGGQFQKNLMTNAHPVSRHYQ